MVAWGPIIGAGVSILGSLFGKDDEEQVTRTEVDYVKMAESAERAGFNPLTAIRNGGSAGFTTTHHPALSSAGGFGEAFATLGNALMSFDARADERAEMEQKLMQAQIDSLNRSGAAASRSFAMDTPAAQMSTVKTSAPLGSIGNPAPAYNYVRDPDTGAVIRVPNMEFVGDIETLATLPAAAGMDKYRQSQTAPGAQRNLPKITVPKPTIDPRNFKGAVEEWFKPWEGVFW